jgi:hypothetical protein
MCDKLKAIISAAADRCEAESVPIDGEPGGAIHQWASKNTNATPAQMFFVVFLLTAELADREARKQGYKDQSDRAAQLAFSR